MERIKLINNNMKTIFYEMLARIGFWIPCSRYMPNQRYWDWVLISFYEPGNVYRYVPEIAEYSHKTKEWHGLLDDKANEWNLNHTYKVTHWHKIPNDNNLKIK